MGKTNFEVQSAILATGEKLSDKFLLVGKIFDDENGLLFYLIELKAGLAQAPKIQKAIVDTIEREFLKDFITEQKFEVILETINASLNKIATADGHKWKSHLNSIIGTINNRNIMLSQSGKISGYIFRKGKVSSLTNSDPDRDLLVTYGDIISGQLMSDDKIVFATEDFYNHISMDRLRRLFENNSALPANQELAKMLKKLRIKDINSILIDFSKDPATPETDALDEDVIFIDQAEETAFSRFQKKATPIIKEKAALGLVHLKKIARTTKTRGQELVDQSKKSWETNLGPKTKKALKQGGEEATQLLKNTKKNLSPTLEKLSNASAEKYNGLKVKTNLYTSTNKGVIAQSIPIVSSYLRSFFTLISKKENRKYLYLAFILIFLTFGYSKIKYNNNNRDLVKQQAEVSSAYDRATDLFNKAKEQYATGKITNSSEFETALASAKQGASFPATKDKSEVLVKEIQTQIDDINKMQRFYSDKITKATLGKTVKKIVAIGAEVYAIDEDGKIFATNPSSGDANLIGSIGKENGNPVSMAYSDSEDKIFILTDKTKVLSFDVKTKTVENTTSENWGTPTALALFSSNLYAINSEDKSIYKYTKAEIGYSKAALYSDGKKNTLTNPIDLAVDGNLFVLLQSGEVAKLNKNVRDTAFSLKTLPNSSKIGEATKLFTSADSNYLYILDKKETRLLRFDKSGAFNAQYTIDGKTITDFTINDKIKKIWLSADNAVYEINLK